MTETTTGRRLTRDQMRVIAFVVIVLLIGIAWLIFAKVIQTEKTTAQTLTEQIERVEIQTDNGDVTLNGSGNSQVAVERSDTYIWREPSFEQTIDGTTLKIKATCDGFRLGPCASDIEIAVPAAVSVSVKSKSGDMKADNIRSDVAVESKSGDVFAKQVYGALEAKATSGDVEFEDIASLRVRAETTSGDVDLETVSGPDSIDVNTNSGDVDVRAPESFGPYKISASSSSGTTKVDLRSDDSAAKAITVRSGSGEVTVTRSQ